MGNVGKVNTTDSGQDQDKKNPDRQTPDSIFSKNPDRIQTADRIETDRIRTGRHLTENTDRIQTPDRIFRQIRTKMRHGQDTDSAVRRRQVVPPMNYSF